jgi:hypothetical protein
MVIHWNEVHIAKHKTVVVIVLQGLLKANIEELGTIEHSVSGLVKKKEVISDAIRPLSRLRMDSDLSIIHGH